MKEKFAAFWFTALRVAYQTVFGDMRKSTKSHWFITN